jgi:hypothetical protein
MSKEIEKKILDVSRITFDSSGRYELEEIVDHDFLQLVGGAGPGELNASECGDEETNTDCDTNYIACGSNQGCPTDDGDGE